MSCSDLSATICYQIYGRKQDKFSMLLTRGRSKVAIYSIGSDIRPRFPVAYYIGNR